MLGERRRHRQRPVCRQPGLLYFVEAVVPQVGVRRPAKAPRRTPANGVVVVERSPLGRTNQRMETHALAPVLWLHPRHVPEAGVSSGREARGVITDRRDRVIALVE